MCGFVSIFLGAQEIHRSVVFGPKMYSKQSNRVRAHACKHSELGGRDKSTTDVTARRSHRPEQKRRGGGGGV